MTTYIVLTIIGLLAGIAGGLLGVGGSIVMIPAMNEFLGPNQHLYQAAAMIVNFFIVVPAMIHHRRVNAINPDVIRAIVPIALVSMLIGVLLSEHPALSGGGEKHLRLLFGLFLLCICVADIYRLFRRKRTAIDELSRDQDADGTTSPVMTWRKAAMIGIPTGLVGGALGVGGGILAVPLQRKILRIPIRNAIANSATIIITTSFVGAIVKNCAYVKEHHGEMRSFILAAVLIPSAIFGSAIGSRLVHKLPVRTVRICFFCALFIVASRLTYQSALAIAGSIHPQPHSISAIPAAHSP